MRTARLAAATVAAVLVVAAASHAADQQILGKRLQVKDRGAQVDDSDVTVVGREKDSDITAISGNPVADGGFLRVIMNGEVTSDESFPLLSGGWTATATGFRFSGGVVRRVVLKRSSSGTVTLRVKMKDTIIAPPNPGTSGGISLTLTGGDTYCVSFPAGGREPVNDATQWRVVSATMQPGCPTPPPTSCCASAGGVCFWNRTATDCLANGGTPGGASDVCNADGTCVAGAATPGPCCNDDDECVAGPAASTVCEGVGGNFVPLGICAQDGTCSPSGAFLEAELF